MLAHVDTETPTDPRALADAIQKTGDARAHAQHTWELLEKTTKSVLSELTNNERRLDPELSRKEAEDIAQGSEEFRAHIYATLDAKRAYNLADVAFVAAKARFEATRSVEASRRAQVQAFGRH